MERVDIVRLSSELFVLCDRLRKNTAAGGDACCCWCRLCFRNFQYVRVAVESDGLLCILYILSFILKQKISSKKACLTIN